MPLPSPAILEQQFSTVWLRKRCVCAHAGMALRNWCHQATLSALTAGHGQDCSGRVAGHQAQRARRHGGHGRSGHDSRAPFAGGVSRRGRRYAGELLSGWWRGARCSCGVSNRHGPHRRSFRVSGVPASLAVHQGICLQRPVSKSVRCCTSTLKAVVPTTMACCHVVLPSLTMHTSAEQVFGRPDMPVLTGAHQLCCICPLQVRQLREALRARAAAPPASAEVNAALQVCGCS